MMNHYTNYPGKPVILDSVEALKLRSELPTQNYFDLLIPTLYGLNERLKPNSPLMAEFQEEWNYLSEHAEDETYGVYVHYPQRNVLVRYMKPKWHELALRVSNSLLYNNPEGGLSWEAVCEIHRNVVISTAGCSVGKRVTENIVANMRPKHIKIADPKAAHVANAPRAGWTYEDIGENKAIAGARQIHNHLDPFINISVYPTGIDHTNIDDFISGNSDIDEPKSNLVIEETDDLDAKIWIREKARAAGIPIIMVSDLGSAIQIDIRRFDIDHSAALAVGISDDELFTKRDIAKKNPGNLTHFYEFAFAMLGKKGMRGEFEKIINKTVEVPFGGVPQLTSTVSASAGWVADIISRMFLGFSYPERVLFDMTQAELITEGKHI